MLYDCKTQKAYLTSYDTSNTLQEWYKMLHCSTVEQTYVQVTETLELAALLDENGWLSSTRPHGGTVLKCDETGYINVFAGSVMFIGQADEEGNTLSLTDEEIQEIYNKVKFKFISWEMADKMNPLN